jgi:hypothetical protein
MMGRCALLFLVIVGAACAQEVSFYDACAKARETERSAPELVYESVLTAGLRNPELALREFDQYVTLSSGRRLFEEFVKAAPDEAMALASGTSKSAHAMLELLQGTPLSRLAQDSSIDLPRRRRVALLAGHMTLEAAMRASQTEQQFFAAAMDARIGDRALEHEALILCRAAQENLNRTLADLARFRARDVYAVLALGRAEATPAVFAAIFDRLLLPKWRADPSLNVFLAQTNDWGLRDFAAGAVDAHRFDALVSVAGRDLVSSLARGIERSSDPLKEATRLAEIVDATTDTALLSRMAAIVSEEARRRHEAGDAKSATLYSLLEARLSADAPAPYREFLQSSQTLDSAALFDGSKNCIQRHFFYDDSDGVESFESFRSTYAGDPAWTIEDRGEYVHLIGRSQDGRQIEIFANVPVRALEGEAQRRQQAISAALAARGLTPSVIVHRGHAFWVERTRSYLTAANRLVILGSCGGTTEVHAVIEASHDAQVIATRGIGATAINDSILKAVNDRILAGGVIEWSRFWRELQVRWGKSGLFRDYVAPNQNSGTMLLRAYYQLLDAAR